MNFILITGVPGTGKTSLSFLLLKNYKLKNYKLINDKEFLEKRKLGKKNKENIIEVSPKNLNKEFNNFFKINKNNIILEGHLWVELNKSILKKFSKIIILKTRKDLLKKRLKKRKYNFLKIQDNLFSQETNYLEEILDSKNIEYKIIKTTENKKASLKRLEDCL